MSHPGAEHHTFIRAVLHGRFGLDSRSLRINRFEWALNNHVYSIELASPTSKPLAMLNGVVPPFATAIPVNTSKLVFRIPKENVTLEDAVGVRNEVAFLNLTRVALASVSTSLVPRVFGYDDGISMWCA